MLKEKAVQAAEWTGHYALPIFTACTAVYIADNCLGNPQSGVMPRLQIVTALASTAVVVGVFRYHSLCVRCMAKTPLDPEASVKRWKRALRVVHWRYLLHFVVAGVLLLFAGSVIKPGPWPTWANAVSSVIDFITLLAFAAVTVHQRLQPWCPWCRWGRGGDEEISPEVPDPSVSR